MRGATGHDEIKYNLFRFEQLVLYFTFYTEASVATRSISKPLGLAKRLGGETFFSSSARNVFF